MPPSRAKLHNKTGKLKTINPSASSSVAPAVQRDSEADRQFELELCWCIQQLERSVNSGKLNPKQAQDTEKSVKILKSGNQPVIKKRQLMRTTFGDYRAKMAEEEKKMSLATRQIKFANTAPSKKSYFVRKSSLLSSGVGFKFNFPVDEIEKLNISDNIPNAENCDRKKVEKVDQQSSSNFNFVPTVNAFRFNFNVEEEKS